MWVVDPGRRVARVYRHDRSEAIVAADGALDGEDVLPGFSCPLAAIFQGRLHRQALFPLVTKTTPFALLRPSRAVEYIGAGGVP